MIRSPAGFDGGDRIKRYLDYYQPSYGVMMLSAGQFSPASLFAAGEQGAWYDPSDFTTMFQDSAGTTPVTAVEQPVGLLLDKSGRANHASQSIDAYRPVLSARVSALTYTEDFSNDVWNKVNCTVSAMNVADPIGGNTAATVTATGSAYFYYGTLENPKSQSLNSVWVRRRTGSGAIKFRTSASPVIDTDYSSSITPSWSLLTWNCTAGTTSENQFVINIVNSGDAIDLWHPDMRSANDGVGLPAYQRVTTSTDYDTAGFPYYLLFDGLNDSLATGTITPGADKTQVFVGIRKTSDAALAIVAELSATIATNAGSFALTAPNSAAANYNFSSKGTTQTNNTITTYTSPLTSVLSGIADIAGASNLIRANGAQVGSNLTTQGTGNYLAYPLYIGRRGGTSNPFTGRLYSLVLRFSATNLSGAQIVNTETWVNGKTGAY